MVIYTIIIPHKNIPSLLKRCLDSIPYRPDIEIIVVDDNSNEESIKELKKICCPKFQIIYTSENKGAGYARNIGLKIAKGKWIIFADADDVFESSFDKILNSLSNDDLSDIVNFDVTSRNSETNEPNNEIEKINYHCTDKKYIKNPISFKYVTLVPWGKIIRKDFIQRNNLSFEEVKYGNDLRFASLCDFHCRNRKIIPIVGYCWMYRQNSLWRQNNLEWAETRHRVLVENGLLMRSLGEKEFGNRLINGSIDFLLEIRKHSYKKFLVTLISYVISTRNFQVLFTCIPYFIIQDIVSSVVKGLKRLSNRNQTYK